MGQLPPGSDETERKIRRLTETLLARPGKHGPKMTLSARLGEHTKRAGRVWFKLDRDGRLHTFSPFGKGGAKYTDHPAGGEHPKPIRRISRGTGADRDTYHVFRSSRPIEGFATLCKKVLFRKRKSGHKFLVAEFPGFDGLVEIDGTDVVVDCDAVRKAVEVGPEVRKRDFSPYLHPPEGVSHVVVDPTCGIGVIGFWTANGHAGLPFAFKGDGKIVLRTRVVRRIIKPLVGAFEWAGEPLPSDALRQVGWQS